MRPAVFAALFVLVHSSTALAETPSPPLMSARDIRDGVEVSEAQCKALASALWLKAAGRHFCIRYWLSAITGMKDEAVVALHGDPGGIKNGKPHLEESAKLLTDARFEQVVRMDALVRGSPHIRIARPGTFGSSGNHVRDRRTETEVAAISAALDAIKARHGFMRFHLVGHSGGGLLAAALAQRRNDLRCVVMASANVSVKSWYRDRGHAVDRILGYDPIEHVSALRGRPGLRLIVISDPDDKVVPLRSQREFVDRVRAKGVPILHLTTAATDKLSHSLQNQALWVAHRCAKGSDDNEIIALFQTKPIAPPSAQSVSAAKPPEPSPVPSAIPHTPARAVPAAPDSPGCSQVGVFATRPLSSCTPEWPRAPMVGQSAVDQLISAQPANQAVTAPPGQVVLRKAVLYEESPPEPDGRGYQGSVSWATETIEQAPAVRASINIPERALGLTIIMRSSTDSTTPTSHSIEMRFDPRAGFAFGGIGNVPGLLMKDAEEVRGVALAGSTAKLSQNAS
jgi:pimeloyl-ACP methyl ester carboxylesterase